MKVSVPTLFYVVNVFILELSYRFVLLFHPIIGSRCTPIHLLIVMHVFAVHPYSAIGLVYCGRLMVLLDAGEGVQTTTPLFAFER